MDVSRAAIAVLLLLAVLPQALADGLRYRIQGAGEESAENIRAYLGESPRDEPAAQRFLATAADRTARALQAVGVYDADIELEIDRSVDPWRVQIQVREGAPVTYASVDVSLSGPGEQDEALLRVVAQNAPRIGDPLHHGRYESFKQTLLRRARERGYFDARLEQREVRVSADRGEASATILLNTGERARFGPLRAPGDLISDRLLQSIQPFAVDDPYSQSALLELRARLLRLGFFNSVVVAPALNEREGNRVPIRVDLQAAPRHSYELGAGFSTDTRQRLSLVWSSPRLNSWGHSQQTRLRYSPINPVARVTYSVPLDDPSNDLLQFGARLEDNEFGDLESEQRELSLRRETSKGGNVRSVSLRALNESWSALEESFDAHYALAGVSFSRRLRRGNAVDPDAGLSQFYALEGGASSLGSDQDLVRFSGTVTGLKRFGERSRFVARLSAGILYSSSTRPDELPPSLAFFAGGDNSIRGYAYQSVGREIRAAAIGVDGRTAASGLVVGGTRLFTASLEYQRYFSETWRGALFVDGGDAFVDSDFSMNAGVGIGVHYLTPIGAIRIEVANPVTESDGDWRLHINIGAEL